MSNLQPTPPDWRQASFLEARSTVKKGVVTLCAFALLFGAWSVATPLSGAVIGHGKVISDGQNSLLQHTTGGRIVDIFVRDGQKVRKGQVVMALNPVMESSEVDRFTQRHKLLLAQQATLRAMLNDTADEGETGGLVGTSVPELRGLAEPDELAQSQNLELEEGLRRHRQELQALQDQMESRKADISALQAKVSGLQRQHDLLSSQLARQGKLAREGYFPRNRLLDAQRQAADLEANLQATVDSINAARSDVKALNAKYKSTAAAFREEVSQKLSDVSTQAKEIQNQITAAEDILKQTEIKSPVDGTLVKLTNQTIGGVIRGGEVIGEIVPDSAPLVVEAKVDPKDIVHVIKGNKAELVFSAFNRHLVDPIVGNVTYVSADSMLDERQGTNYFLARVSFSPDEIKSKEAVVVPGLAAEVFIQTEPRTFMSYLMKPMADSFRRAFREP